MLSRIAVDSLWMSYGERVGASGSIVYKCSFMHIAKNAVRSFPRVLHYVCTQVMNTFCMRSVSVKDQFSALSTEPITTTHLIYKGALI